MQVTFGSVYFFRRHLKARSFILSFLFIILTSQDAFAAEHFPLNLKYSPLLTSGKDSSNRKIKGQVYFDTGLLFLKESYKDFIVSPNTYTSTNLLPLVNIGFEKRYPKYSGYTAILAGSQNLNDPSGILFDEIPASLFTVKLNTSRVYNLHKPILNYVNWKAGYLVNMEYTHRLNDKFQNAAYTFDIWANAGVANRFEFPFSIKTERKLLFIHFRNPEQNFMLSWQVNVPLLGAITRPNYSGIRHFANGAFFSNLFREMEDNLEFVSVNKFIMVQSHLELLAPLGNNNKLKIAYEWQGFRYNNELHRLQGSWGGILVGVMFKIDSREVVRGGY